MTQPLLESSAGAESAERQEPLRAALHRWFGFASFREGQEDVIRSLLQGRDSVAVMPTGAGKSLCYQLPALLLDGVTLVISPLIALMKDQVDALLARGIAATFVNSSLRPAEQDRRLHELAKGAYRLCYVAPERFRSRRFVAMAARLRVALFAVDEAHCISQWGHDFRPDYLRLQEAAEKVGRPPIGAFTATATHGVVRDIVAGLGLNEPRLFAGGFDRPNLFIECHTLEKRSEKLAHVLEVVRREQTGIVYAATRKGTEDLCQALRSAGEDASCYHAGLDDETRRSVQEDFMAGRVQVVVATNAFGMGIDKPDIRFVIHADIPRSIEAYYQEIGRAGRDGARSHCLLLFHPADTRIQRFFIESNHPERAVIEGVFQALVEERRNPVTLTNTGIAEKLRGDVPEMAVSASLKVLEDAEVIDRFYGGSLAQILVRKEGAQLERYGHAPVRRAVVVELLRRSGGEPETWIDVDPASLARACDHDLEAVRRVLALLQRDSLIDYIPAWRGRMIRLLPPKVTGRKPEIDDTELRARRLHELEKLSLMVTFARDGQCRRRTILAYFTGKAPAKRCGHCDVCRDRRDEAIPQASGEALVLVQKVLSAVGRLKGSYGKHRVVQVLRGSRSRDVPESLRGLSVYGLLSGVPESRLLGIVDELISLGAVDQTTGAYPLVSLTALGYAMALGRAPVRLRSLADWTPPQARAPRSAAVAPVPSGDSLHEKLKDLRRRLAKERHLPAYKVFSNRTLDEIASRRPRSAEAFLGIHGVGPATLRRFWEPVRSIIDAHVAGELERTGHS
ncbi:MAG: ATP-dependent DNA helicase RecQ [Planctomycetota bacterium]